MMPRPTITAFDRHLANLGLYFEGVVIGGAALAPTADELAECGPWLERQDANEDWPAHIRSTLVALGRRLGHGV